MPQTESQVRGGYREVETLTDPGGTIAIITERVGKGTFSAAFFRIFERDNVQEKTNFFHPEHLDSLIRIAAVARKRMETLKCEAKVVPERKRA